MFNGNKDAAEKLEKEEMIESMKTYCADTWAQLWKCEIDRGLFSPETTRARAQACTALGMLETCTGSAWYYDSSVKEMMEWR